VTGHDDIFTSGEYVFAECDVMVIDMSASNG
jgi:hypothetical protein